MEKQERFAFESGYRAACIAHGIPFTKVEVTKVGTFRISVEYSLDALRYYNDIVRFISDDVARKLEKAIKEHDYGRDICIQP